MHITVVLVNLFMNEAIAVMRPRRANERVRESKDAARPQLLFDEFWREGEMSLMFGPPGVGKSVLAVQICEALARGTGIEGFQMPSKRQKVLYVDLKLSAEQFRRRYLREASDASYRFSQNLYCDRPPDPDGFIDWLRDMTIKNEFRVVVIDELDVFKTTHDGTRESFPLMLELKRLKDELKISMLVLLDSDRPRPGAYLGEIHLRRSRVLCDLAESVVAIGPDAQAQHGVRIVQTRSSNAAIVWNEQNAPRASIGRSANGLLQLEFNERFVCDSIDPGVQSLICGIKEMVDSGESYREIGKKLRMSHMRVSRYHKQWRPTMMDTRSPQPEPEATEVRGPDAEEPDEWDEAGLEKPLWVDFEKQSSTPNEADVRRKAVSDQIDVQNIPFAAALGRRSIYELKSALDGYGREIFVESEREGGKPQVYYRIDKQGTINRHEYKWPGWQVKRVGIAPYLPFANRFAWDRERDVATQSEP